MRGCRRWESRIFAIFCRCVRPAVNMLISLAWTPSGFGACRIVRPAATAAMDPGLDSPAFLRQGPCLADGGITAARDGHMLVQTRQLRHFVARPVG